MTVGAASGALAGVFLLSWTQITISTGLVITTFVNAIGLIVGNLANFLLYCKSQPIVLGKVKWLFQIAYLS